MRIPKIKITKTWDGFVEFGQIELPEKYMDQYEKLIGNGKAGVTVSADMSLKEFGSGAGAMVSVSLSCGQDKDTIEQAIDLAGQLARTYCVEQQSLAEKELQNSKKAPF